MMVNQNSDSGALCVDQKWKNRSGATRAKGDAIARKRVALDPGGTRHTLRWFPERCDYDKPIY